MRDIALFLVLAALVFVVPRRPYVGALAWVVFGIMYPHRLAFGAAYSFPFSQVIALLTLVGLLLTKEHRQFKGGVAATLLFMLLVWAGIGNLFAFNPSEALVYLERVAKVVLMTFVLLLLIHSREQVIALVWCLVVSLGFYGVKGGIFVIATGGQFMVNGPPDSAMEGNNSLGTGTVIIIPLLYYLIQVTANRWVRWGLMVALPLCAVSVLGSYSRGALLAMGGTALLLWARSRHKAVIAIGAAAFVAVALPFMPDHWTARMDTIVTYEQDLSAMQRVWAWETAYNIAKDRFPVGGGFEFHSPQTSAKYSPNPASSFVAHSIYFQVLGSLGFLGLLLFLLFWGLVWREAGRLRTRSRGDPASQWAHTLGSMVQASLFGYFIGGAFLDIAFWDLNYYLFTAIVGAHYALDKTQRARNVPANVTDVRVGNPATALLHPPSQALR